MQFTIKLEKLLSERWCFGSFRHQLEVVEHTASPIFKMSAFHGPSPDLHGSLSTCSPLLASAQTKLIFSPALMQENEIGIGYTIY